MRRNDHVRFGQVWALSDPRRLSCFIVLNVFTNDEGEKIVCCVPLYPRKKPHFTVPFRKFLETGSRGYHRLK